MEHYTSSVYAAFLENPIVELDTGIGISTSTCTHTLQADDTRPLECDARQSIPTDIIHLRSSLATLRFHTMSIPRMEHSIQGPLDFSKIRALYLDPALNWWRTFGKDHSNLKTAQAPEILCEEETQPEYSALLAHLYLQDSSQQSETTENPRKQGIVSVMFLPTSSLCLPSWQDEKPFYCEKTPRHHIWATDSVPLCSAVDMMQYEHAVYSRMEKFQGTFIPHVYGFHEITLPEGRNLYGFFTEIIEGKVLTAQEFWRYPVKWRAYFLHRLRHAIRALALNRISQEDWNAGQIIFTNIPELEEGRPEEEDEPGEDTELEEMEDEEDRLDAESGETEDEKDRHDTELEKMEDWEDRLDFVLVDFAFTELRLGSLREGKPVGEIFGGGLGMARFNALAWAVFYVALEMGPAITDESVWFAKDDFEA